MKHLQFILCCLLMPILTLAQALPADSIPIDKLRLPPGYKVEVYASGLANAREMDFGTDGTLFVGSMNAGKVFAVKKDRTIVTIDEGLDMPAGVDFYEGNLYVAEVSRILVYDNILQRLDSNPGPRVLNANLPKEEWQGWKFIRISPEGWLYVPVGAGCNACIPDSIWHARILRLSLDGSSMEIYALGVRNCLGLDWDPYDKVLWFTDMGRDDLGDDYPPDELNKAYVDGQHFGFPYVNGSKPDQEFWLKKPKSSLFIAPVKELPAHSGAQGMRFYTGKMFDMKYRGGIFIAEHGFWGRTKQVGYRISFFPMKEGEAGNYEVFCEGWLQGKYPWGRPVDVQTGPDGALYVSDDLAGCIYRIFK
jgi:glucose/arabinose dehydrogenase